MATYDWIDGGPAHTDTVNYDYANGGPWIRTEIAAAIKSAVHRIMTLLGRG